MAPGNSSRQAVFVDGVRTPFLRAGTDFKTLSAYDIGRLAIGGLINKTKLDGSSVDHVIMGNVIQDINTSNVARECSLGAGLPDDIPAHTISLACVSSNRAITDAVNAIACGNSSKIIAGGTEIMSDIPIRFRKKFRQKLLETQKYKSPLDYLKFFKGLRFSDILPEIPSIAEYSTGETMGESCDKMSAKFGISREEEDEYALRSHKLAAKAEEKGYFDDEMFPVPVPPSYKIVDSDNGIRGDSTLEKLQSLRPAFTKPHGTHTAGNSSFLTDGASASLIMEEKAALDAGYKPKALIHAFTYVAQKPGDELLIGPAFAVPIVLDRMKLTVSDIDVFEFHEAFAGQILTVLKALGSDTFARERLGRDKKVGEIPMDKFNLWGGSLSVGHPFGATGVRLVTTAANRLIHEDGKYGLIAACAAGGQGHAMIIERYNQ